MIVPCLNMLCHSCHGVACSKTAALCCAALATVYGGSVNLLRLTLSSDALVCHPGSPSPLGGPRKIRWCPSIACTKGRQRDAGRLLIESVDESQMALGNRQGVEQTGGYSPTGPARSRSTSTFWLVLRRELPSVKARLAMG